MWGCFGSRQRGQLTSTGRDAFHWERRVRVLLRDIFRFGTATSILLGHPRGRGRSLIWSPRALWRGGCAPVVDGSRWVPHSTGSLDSLLVGLLRDVAERLPTRVDTVAVTVVGPGVGELDTALGAQAGAVRAAQR